MENSTIRKSYTWILGGFLYSLSGLMPVTAWDSEIRVDGQLIPAEVMDGFKTHQIGIENHCPPHSEVRSRDRLVRTWLRVEVAKERGLKMNEDGKARAAKLEEELTGDRGKSDPRHRNKYHWLMLSHKSKAYWRSTIGKVSDEEIAAEYERLVKNGDPRFVNAPLFKLMLMETNDEQYLKQLAERLNAGETWREVSKDVDPLDWNSHNKDMWFTFDRLDRYQSKAFHALNLKSSDLQRNSVIGPLSEVGRFRLIVVLDKTTEQQIPLNAELMNLKKWAYREIQGDLYAQRHRDLDTSLLEGVSVTENGEPVSVAMAHDRCPG